MVAFEIDAPVESWTLPWTPAVNCARAAGVSINRDIHRSFHVNFLEMVIARFRFLRAGLIRLLKPCVNGAILMSSKVFPESVLLCLEKTLFDGRVTGFASVAGVPVRSTRDYGLRVQSRMSCPGQFPIVHIDYVMKSVALIELLLSGMQSTLRPIEPC
jgi:hypothetical protein